MVPFRRCYSCFYTPFKGNNKSVHTFVFRYMECMNALIKSKRGTARYAVFS